MGIITLTKHPQDIGLAPPPETGAGAPEITDEMIDAGAEVIQQTREYLDAWGMAERVYTAMQERQSSQLR